MVSQYVPKLSRNRSLAARRLCRHAFVPNQSREPLTGLAAHAPTRAELQAMATRTGPLSAAERKRKSRARQRAVQQAANPNGDHGPGPLNADAFRAGGLGQP